MDKQLIKTKDFEQEVVLYIQLRAFSEDPTCYQKSSFWKEGSSSKKDP